MISPLPVRGLIGIPFCFSEDCQAKMTAATVEDPKFIKFLLNPLDAYDCYITVGNPSIAPVETIGVVPKMLFAHSEVMRTDLQMKNIKDKVPYEILDILPHTFKNLLRFMYGHDTSSTLSFDEADNLLYAAEKYMVSDLKNSLALRLMSLLNYDNICSLMNNRACYEALELNASINKILQTETRKVFASPHFLELTSDAFVKILEQEALNVREVEIWRNALLWAKHQANSEDGGKLRKELVRPLQHIRLCTLSKEDFFNEILPIKVLSGDEAVAVGISIGNKQTSSELTEICPEVQERKLCNVKSKLISKSVTLGNFKIYSYDCKFVLDINELAVELTSLTVCVTGYGANNGHQFKFTVNIEQVDRPETKTSVVFTAHSPHEEVTIPVSTEEQEVLLQPNSQYKINIMCNYQINVYTSANPLDNEHFSLTYSLNNENSASYSIKKFKYKTVNV